MSKPTTQRAVSALQEAYVCTPYLWPAWQCWKDAEKALQYAVLDVNNRRTRWAAMIAPALQDELLRKLAERNDAIPPPPVSIEAAPTWQPIETADRDSPEGDGASCRTPRK